MSGDWQDGTACTVVLGGENGLETACWGLLVDVDPRNAWIAVLCSRTRFKVTSSRDQGRQQVGPIWTLGPDAKSKWILRSVVCCQRLMNSLSLCNPHQFPEQCQYSYPTSFIRRVSSLATTQPWLQKAASHLAGGNILTCPRMTS